MLSAERNKNLGVFNFLLFFFCYLVLFLIYHTIMDWKIIENKCKKGNSEKIQLDQWLIKKCQN